MALLFMIYLNASSSHQVTVYERCSSLNITQTVPDIAVSFKQKLHQNKIF